MVVTTASWAFGGSLASLLALVIFLRWRTLCDESVRERVPHRIHVAGTRGKSSVVRLIAAGLREAGFTTVGKVTGSRPAVVDVDGNVVPWRRRGLPSVREQARFLELAVSVRADVAVIECMAIAPEFLWASEHRLVHAQVAVVTNARPDHWETLGNNDEAMAMALVEVVPTEGHLIVSDEAEASDREPRPFQHRVRVLGSKVTVVPTASSPPAEALRALAVEACSSLGVDAEVARRGMEVIEAIGIPPVHEVPLGHHLLRFVDALSCNDPVSLGHLARSSPPDVQRADVVLLHVRGDRPIRTRRFVGFLDGHWPNADVVVVGRDPWARRAMKRNERGNRRVRWAPSKAPEDALREVVSLLPRGGIVWGIGNSVGFAPSFLHELEKEKGPC